MNPWTIIGWVVVGLMSLPIAYILFKLAILCVGALSHYYGHLKTRNDKPEKGQRWRIDHANGSLLIVDAVDEYGSVHLKSGNSSFGHSADKWKDYVRNRRLRRVS
jgi:hypothetical protein